MQLNENDLQRFWSKIDRGGPDECWGWLATTNHKYGYFWLRGKDVLAHHVSWFIHHDEWPGQNITWICGNSRCQNPAHMRRMDKDSSPKIDMDTATAIRQKYDQGASYDDLIAEFGISRQSVSVIIRNESFYDPDYESHPPRDSYNKKG